MDTSKAEMEEGGYLALRGHMEKAALFARQKYGGPPDYATVLTMLEDREVVRFPTRLLFESEGLLEGEFAHASMVSEDPVEGFTLRVHPLYEKREEDLPLLIAYHLVTINYLQAPRAAEAELFGATLMGMDVEAYYQRLCTLADLL